MKHLEGHFIKFLFPIMCCTCIDVADQGGGDGWDGEGWLRPGGVKGSNSLFNMKPDMRTSITFAFKPRQGEVMEEGGAALFKLLFHVKVNIFH